MTQHSQPRTIHLSATISPSTITLSNLSPGPVHLKLSLRLENSPGPITISRPHSCLRPSQTGPSSTFYLLNPRTGTGPDRVSISANLLSSSMTIKTDDLITLYPGKAVETEIAVAGFKPTSKLASTWICGARVGDLRAGEKYGVKWGPQGIQVGWWAEGTKESVVWKNLGMLGWMRAVGSWEASENPGDRIHGIEFEVGDLPEIWVEK